MGSKATCVMSAFHYSISYVAFQELFLNYIVENATIHNML